MYVEFLDGKKHAAKNADLSDTHEHFKDAGYVLTENDLIVDIDNLPKDVIEKMISLFNIKTQIVFTERGVHLYFKKPTGFRGSRKVIPLGFEIEYKHISNTKHITIKRDGVLRKIENEGVREDLPSFLFARKRLDSLLGIGSGEGRNQALYKHRMKIHDIKEWASICRFINNHIFDEPLDEAEFQLVVRDVKIEVGKDDEPTIADYMMTKYKIVKYGEQIYFYYEGEFISDIPILQRVIYSEIGLQKTRFVDEVIKQIKYRSPIVDRNKQFDIKFRNGILRDGKFIEVDYQEFTPFSIDIPYLHDAKPVKIVDDYLSHLTKGDSDYRNLLLEVLAHPLIVNKEFKRMMGKFFIFVGGGGNGKGTLLTVIRRILNSKNCTGLSIDDMCDEKYFTTMEGKLANLGDDIEDKPINDRKIKILKNISTCDYVATRNLYEQSREIELTTTLIFTSNNILKSFEKGDSFKRRIIWLPTYTKVEKKDGRFISKLTSEESLKYWVRLIVEAYFRLYETETFSDSERVNDFNSAYHAENNSVLQYLVDYDADHFIGRRSPECYEEYEVFAEENGLSVQSRKLFVQTVCDVMGLEIGVTKINKRSARVFMVTK